MTDIILPMIQQIALQAKDASRALSSATTIQKNDALQAIARELESSRKILIEENEKDLKAAYGLAKLKSTNYLMNLSKKIYFPFTVIRFFLVYGPGQLENRLIPFVIKNCLADKKFKTSSGIQTRDFLYIDDAVDAIFAIMYNKISNGHIINICSNSPVKIKYIIKLIHKKIKKGKPIFGKVNLRPDEPIKLYSNYKKANKILNWKPKINLYSGINKTIRYYAKGL